MTESTSFSRAEMYTRQFIDDLPAVKTVRPFITDYEPEEEPTQWAVNRFLAYHAEPNTLFLSPPFVQAYEEGNFGSLTFLPRGSSSHRKSSHGVFFGDMQMGRGSIGLAVKPFEHGDAWSPAVREQIITGAFRKMGFHTLAPLGIMLGDDSNGREPMAYGLTMLYETLTSFDSVEWSDYYTERLKHPAMRGMWRSLATTFAQIHDRGTMCHNDPWGRNQATSLFKPGFEIDEEHSTIDVRDVRDAETRFGRSQKDLLIIGKSVCYPLTVPYDQECGLGIVTDHQRQDWFTVFHDVFLGNYLRDRKTLLSEHDSEKDRADIKDEVAQLLVDMKMHFRNFQDYHLQNSGE